MIWQVIPGSRGGELREVKQRRWESQSKGMSSSWSILWQWPQGALGGCAWGWSLWGVGERIVGDNVNSLHPSHLVHATKGLAAWPQAGSQARTGHLGAGEGVA